MLRQLNQDDEATKVEPSPKVALLVFAGYVATIVAANFLFARDIDFADVAANAANTRNGIVLPVGLASVYLTIVTSLLGWWRPALHEPRDRPPLPKWLWMFPIAVLALAIGDVARSEFLGDFEAAHWPYLVIGCALVGYSEELMTRGLLITGFRARYKELWVYLFSTLLFCLMHGLNVLFGQDVGTTIAQVAGVFPMATFLYFTRRVTGALFLSMLCHALFDFSLLVYGGPGGDLNHGADGGGTIAGFVPFLVIVVMLIMAKRFFAGAPSPESAAATL